jgi:hypothetical protein
MANANIIEVRCDMTETTTQPNPLEMMYVLFSWIEGFAQMQANLSGDVADQITYSASKETTGIYIFRFGYRLVNADVYISGSVASHVDEPLYDFYGRILTELGIDPNNLPPATIPEPV